MVIFSTFVFREGTTPLSLSSDSVGDLFGDGADLDVWRWCRLYHPWKLGMVLFTPPLEVGGAAAASSLLEVGRCDGDVYLILVAMLGRYAGCYTAGTLLGTGSAC